MSLTQIEQTAQNLILQRSSILTTGSVANASQLADYNAKIELSGGFGAVDTLIDNHIQMLVSQQGLVATIQGMAKNGYGLTLTNAEAQFYINTFTAAGINSGSKLVNYLNTLQWEFTSTLNNRAEAASDFIDTLNDAGKGAAFNSPGVTHATYILLQNIDGTTTSLANGKVGFDALSANLSATGITATLDGYLSGATVFADANSDGQLNAGEWSTTTSVNGTFELPNTIAADKIVAFGGTDLLTGNAFKSVLSSSTCSTMLNPITSVIEAMVASGDAGSVNEATSAIKEALSLPANINLLSYNALAVLASSTATPAEKAVALQVQKASQQISNIITQTASVIDTATPGQTLQSAALAVTDAIASAIATAAGNAGGTINLADAATIAGIIQASVAATGSTTTSTEVDQIAQVTAGSNLSAASATTITMLAQAADVAQGSATNALIAGAGSNDFSAAVSGFTGSALTAASYNVTVGSIAPGVIAPSTIAQALAAAAAAAEAAAAQAAALEAPTAVLTYSTDGGTTASTTATVNDADTLRIIATFDKAVSDGTPTITINNAIQTVVAMTKTDSTHYFYDLNVPAGDFASATVTIGGAKTATSNIISEAPSNAVFAVDNTAPTVAVAVSLTPVGGTVVVDTLNTTNTNLTATATIVAGEATGGSAVLKIGATTIASDSAILSTDTSVSFNLSTANNTALKAAVAAGGLATVTVTDAAGNSSVSAVSNPTLTVAYVAPSAPTGVALTPVGGTVVTNSLNNTNTNLTAVATITPGQATGGSAVLKVGDTAIATDSTILIGDSTVTFDLSPADNAALQLLVAAGGVATVTVTDVNGNASVSNLSNPTLAVDYLAAFVSMTTAVEAIAGTASNDTFTGSYGNGAGPYTFNLVDTFDGQGGIDTLNIITGAEASTPPDGLWQFISNFEKVVFNSIGNGAQSITTGANFEAAFADEGVDVTVQTLLGAIDLTMTTFTGAADITTITTGSGAHSIVTGSGETTVNATGISAGAQTINGVGLTTVTATINGAGNQVIGTTSGGNLTDVKATILAAGDQTIESTSNNNVNVVASAAAGAQTVTTAGGDDNITITGASGNAGTISSGAGDDTIVAGLTTDLITGGTGSDTITGGGGVDTFAFGTDGSVIGTDRDIITDFNASGADIISFGGSANLLTADLLSALTTGTNVHTSAGGLITFAAADDTLAEKIIAIQADVELDVAGSVGMFVDSGNTYVYYSGAIAGNADDQLIQLTGITTLTAMTGGAALTIA